MKILKSILKLMINTALIAIIISLWVCIIIHNLKNQNKMLHTIIV